MLLVSEQNAGIHVVPQNRIYLVSFHFTSFQFFVSTQRQLNLCFHISIFKSTFLLFILFRSNFLTGKCLPLMYLNTSVFRFTLWGNLQAWDKYDHILRLYFNNRKYSRMQNQFSDSLCSTPAGRMGWMKMMRVTGKWSHLFSQLSKKNFISNTAWPQPSDLLCYCLSY